MQQLTLYQKLAIQSSPKNKSKKQVLKEAKLTGMPEALNTMVADIKPTYEKRQIEQMISELRKHQSLSTLLIGVKPEQLTNEELVLLMIWTSPLVTTTTTNDEYSIYARGILGVDVLQAQGLLRNCQTQENHLINIVESYFNLARQMPENQYIQVLRNAVYNLDKAYELQETLANLGENWFNLKEQIKTLKLEEAPKIENPKLAKGIQLQGIGGKKAANLKEYQEVDILIKLIPFFDIPMSKSSKEIKEATLLRKLMNLAKSEAEMILRKKHLYTLIDTIKAYFDKLLLPENLGQVEAEFLDCFFQNKQRAKLFVQTLARIVWEYNYINKMFIEHFKKLLSVTQVNPQQNIPQSRELLIFGGHYPLSSGQISNVHQILDKYPEIKGLSLNFTRIKNQGLALLMKAINSKKWRTIRLHDELLFSLDLTNNFIDQDGMKHLLEVFFDSYDLKTASLHEAPFPTSIRILILDYNFLGKGGADVMGTILSSSRQLKVLSLNRTRLGGNDLKKLCQSLSVNPYLKVLNMGQNRLGNAGIQAISNAIKVNIGLTMLDLFDVEFSDDGALSLAEAILINKTLTNIRLANTKVQGTGAVPLLKWINLMPLPAKEEMEPKDITRVFQIESRNNRISRGEYLNPFLGDLPFELYSDIFKCAHFSRTKDPSVDRELESVLQSYCTFVIENWKVLEKGKYNTLTQDQRPEITFKQIVTEDIIRDNLPELTLEERVLVKMETMDVPKISDAKGKKEDGKEFKMLEAEKKQSEKVIGSKTAKKIPTNNQQLQEEKTQLDSVPSFSMSEFGQGTPFTKNLAKELLVIIIQSGIDINFLNKQGYTPLQESIRKKLKSLQQFLMSGYIKDLDVNMRCNAIGNKMSTAMHFAVELKKKKILKLILDYPGDPKRELGLKDANGKNPMDLAADLKFTKIFDLLKRYGGFESSQALQEQQKLLQLMKPISTKKSEVEEISIFNTIIANRIDRFQHLLLMGEDVNQRDTQNQTPLHYTVHHGREAMLMMLMKQNAFVDAKDVNGMTALHHAASKKDAATQAINLKIMERLIQFGANVDSQMKDGSTPLHLACQFGSFANAKLLCSMGAQTGIINFAKQSPEQVTTNKEIIELIKRVREERKRKNGGGDEYVTDIM